MFSSSSPSLPSKTPVAVTRVSKRLVKELAQLQKNPPPSVAAWPVNDNPHKLNAQLCGPAESPYEGGVFRLELNVPESYPLDPPSVSFLTPLYHPNVDERGRICLDTLSLPPKGRWSPAMTLAALLTTVHQLMAYPNGQDGLVREVADVFNSDREQFNRRAREMTAQHAVERKDEQRQGQGDEEESKQEKKEGGGQLTTDTSDGSAAAVASGSAKRERPTGGSEAGDGASGGGAADAEEEPDAKKSRLS